MADQALYCRAGWKPKLLSVVGEDKAAGTVDLGSEDGEPVVTGLVYLADPSSAEVLPAAYASPVKVTAPKSSFPKKKAPKKKAVAPSFEKTQDD